METLEQHEMQLEELNDQYFDNLSRLEETFGQEKLEEAVRLGFEYYGRRLPEMRESAFREYKAAAAKGLSFKERQKLVNWDKVKWCDAEMERLANLGKRHHTLPFAQWFQPEDWNWIRSSGLRRFVELNFNRIVQEPIKN